MLCAGCGEIRVFLQGVDDRALLEISARAAAPMLGFPKHKSHNGKESSYG